MKLQPKHGTIHPNEYNWQAEFNHMNPAILKHVPSVAKVYGLALAYQDALDEIERLEQELTGSNV